MWTATTSPLDGGEVSGCVWASDLSEFLAVGEGWTVQTIARSPDGINWTRVTTPFDDGHGVGAAVARVISLGLYVVAGDFTSSGAGTLITSPDGVTWTDRGQVFSTDASGTCVACKQTTGALVAGSQGGSGDNIATSANGTSWTARSSLFNGAAHVFGIDYSPGTDRWIACGVSGVLAPLLGYSDDDGATWTAITGHHITAFHGAGVYRDEANGKWYLLGETSGGKAVSVSSDNGATWTQVATPFDGGNATAMIDIGSGVLALSGAEAGDQMVFSVDSGATWAVDPTAAPFVGLNQILCLAYAPPLNRVVIGAAVGGGATRMALAYGLPGTPLEGRVFIAFEDGPLEPAPAWTRIDGGAPFPEQFVSGYDTSSGRQTLLEVTNTGTATVYINDHDDGLFDPRNAASDYFGKLDGRQILLQLYDPFLGVWVPQFRGWIDFATYDINGSAVNAAGEPINASIQLECVDMFDILAGHRLTPGLDGVMPTPGGMEDGVYYAATGIGGSVDDRIIEILADVGIDPTRYIVAEGNVHVIEVKYDPDESALVALRDACDAEIPFIANMYINRSGQFVFRGRYSRFYPDQVAAEAGSEWDFTRWAVGDGKAIVADSTRAQMRVLSYTRGRQDIINVAVCYPQNITSADMPGQVFADTTSITDYGTHNAPPMSDLLTEEGTTSGFDKNTETAAFAELLVKNKKNPHIAVSALQVKTVHPTDARAERTWAFLTRSDISHIVNIAVGYPGGTGLTGNSPADDHFIEGRSLRVRPLEPTFDYVELNVETTPADWSQDSHGVFPNPFS